jgi:hypothetical protein
MDNLSGDSLARTAHVANSQIGADPRLPTIQEEEEDEVMCNTGNEYILHLLIDALHRYSTRRTKISQT